MPSIPTTQWTVSKEPLEGPDTFTDAIVQRAVSKESFCVEGPAGTGKSQVLLAVEAALKEQGQKVAKISLTHVATRNLGPGASTAHNFVIRHILNGTYQGHVVLIDEIGFMSLDLLACLEGLRQQGTRLICFGDWRQLPQFRIVGAARV